MGALRLLCDEHVGQKQLYPKIKNQFYAQHVVGQQRQLGAGTNDEMIWKYAYSNKLTVFTNDDDFHTTDADPQNGTHPGVIYYDDSATPSKIIDGLQAIASVTSTNKLRDQDIVLFVPGRWA